MNRAVPQVFQMLLSLSRLCAAATLLAVVAACTTAPSTPPRARPPAPAPAPLPPPPAKATELTITQTTFSAIDQWAQDDQSAALAAFRKSCAAVQKRTDISGLTLSEDWVQPCTEAAFVQDARAFFETRFVPVRVGDGKGRVTGYFEPTLMGARAPDATNATALFRRPPELIDVNLGQFRESLRGQRIAGQVEQARLVPYLSRTQIEEGGLAGRSLELVWVADPWEAFFLHIQGSGRVQFSDGSIMRVGYDGQNGHPYTGIGTVMLERGLLAPGQATMQGMIAWARANPEQAKTLFRENASFIFFRELTGEGPVGAMNVALTPERSIAVDPRFVPLGAPVWLATRHPDPADVKQTLPFIGLRVAQDTGGAIKGANRVDMFWGPGERAALIAGGMHQRGELIVLIPLASAQRLMPERLASPPAGPISASR